MYMRFRAFEMVVGLKREFMNLLKALYPGTDPTNVRRTESG